MTGSARTAIAFQGGGALGAYALGVLRYIYETEPGFRPSYVSGVSIGAFTAAIVASAPEDPVTRLTRFWKDVTAIDWPFMPDWFNRSLSSFGNPAFYRPRLDTYDALNWTSLYDLSPIERTLGRYVDLDRIARGEVKLAITATDIASGTIRDFTNQSPDEPLTLDHIIASGSLPPGFPPRTIGGTAYWDGGLFDNTPLSALLSLVPPEYAKDTRVLVVNLFPTDGPVPANMAQVLERMVELQFANKTQDDVKLAQIINALLIAIETLTGKPFDGTNPIFAGTRLGKLDQYRVYDNIVAVTNTLREDASAASDFSEAAIEARVAAGYRNAADRLHDRSLAAATLRQAISV